MTAVAVVATVVVVGPALIPFGAGPDVTRTTASPAPVTTRASLAPTTTAAPITSTTEFEESGDSEQGSLWRRIDPTTLEDIAGASALLLGEPGRSVFGPDGGTVASFTYPIPDNSEELVIADLRRWQVQERLSLDGWVVNDQSGAVEGPIQATFLSETELAWIAQLPTEHGDEPVANDYALLRYRLGQARPEIAHKFPKGFAPSEMRLLTGDRIAVFGSPVVFDEETPDDARWPQLLVIDAKTGRLEWDVPIPGLIAGHPWKGDEDWSFLHPGLGWDLDGERLYIAHADRLAVTVLDLIQGAVIGEREISLPTSLRRQLALWLLPPPAEAKLQEGTRRNVRVDPDGDRLYLTGVRWELVRNDKGEVIDEQQVALGLTVLDLPTLDVITHLDLPVSDVEISPDGSIVLLTGVWDGRVVDSDPEQSGLHVLEADTLEERGHLWPGTIPWIHTFSDDGQAVYATIWEDGASHLMLLDLGVMDVAAERVLATAEQSSFELPRLGLTSVWAGD